MQENNERLVRFAILCGQCNCGCPELFVDHEAVPDRRIVVTDDFGQRVQMSMEQFQVLIDQARSGQFDQVLSGLAAASSNAVFGAAYTSQGYISSLQSAIDKVGT